MTAYNHHHLPTPKSGPENSHDPDAWCTPADIVELARTILGGSIDVDPASCELAQKTVRAKRHYTKADNGLSKPWGPGTVFLNPPYSRRLLLPFVERFVSEWQAENITAGIVIVPNTVETEWGQILLSNCTCFCAVRRRIRFYRREGTGDRPRTGSIIFYFGDELGLFQRNFAERGTICQRCADYPVAYWPPLHGPAANGQLILA